MPRRPVSGECEAYVDGTLAELEELLTRTLRTVGRGATTSGRFLPAPPTGTDDLAQPGVVRYPGHSMPQNAAPARPDPSGPWVIDTRDLGRRPGSMRTYHRDVPPPRVWG